MTWQEAYFANEKDDFSNLGKEYRKLLNAERR
jgi:hypothetical protein